MPKKSKKGKRKKGKKGKKGKKKKIVPEPPPLHELTTLYNKLLEEAEEFNAARNKARKKRIEAWYMTREIMSLQHDQDVYHKYLEEKMEDLENLFNELSRQLQEERDAVEKIIAQRKAEMDRLIEMYKERSRLAEEALQKLKTQLQEFEPFMRELAALMTKLKELQALIPIYELEANIKTRHLKNQYLQERSKLHNHLEHELYILIMTLRSHLMPLLSDHMTSMELENRCSRWELGVLDEQNFKLYRERENLLERRNRLNMEREYLSIDWAFNKLVLAEAKNKEKRAAFKSKKKSSEAEEECELSIAFRAYLSKKMGDIEEAKEREKRAQRRREARERKRKLELEKKRRADILARKRAKFKAWKKVKAGLDTEEEEGDEDELGEWGELEYYEDEEGNWVIATPSRMLQHKAILENKALDEVEQQVEDIKKMIKKKKKVEGEEDEEGSSESSSGSSGSGSSGSSSGSWSGESGEEGSLATLTDLDNDFGDFGDDLDPEAAAAARKKARKERRKKKKEAKGAKGDGFGDFDDFGGADDFGGFDTNTADDAV